MKLQKCPVCDGRGIEFPRWTLDIEHDMLCGTCKGMRMIYETTGLPPPPTEEVNKKQEWERKYWEDIMENNKKTTAENRKAAEGRLYDEKQKKK